MDKAEYGRMHAQETNYWWFVGRRAIMARLLHRAQQKLPGASLHLLDVGCGTGANLPMLREAVGAQGKVVGIDFSPLALQFAASHPGSSQVCLLQGDAQRLPFADASFDVVTMLDVLEHLPDDEMALQEVLRVLRPGGYYIFSVPAYRHLWSRHDEVLHHFRRYEYRTLRHLLRRQGFRIELLSFAMSLMPPVTWAYRRFVLPLRPRRTANSHHNEVQTLPSVPPLFNRALVKYLHTEGQLLLRYRINFGTSLLGIVQKPPQ
jgi:ubiquinone/menaquinone biosynthesis C-methylase UbiE